ncbi:MAG TPA: TrbG/VirB9 family P-type conjugative transfer protein [Steroidobacteraceae bacterium]|jgi:type IV secretion system protein VirB9|nr:TrbG/VirB9 family P-type conjugative transfer protein [Steroidobacteraceae bacterium]
MSSPTGVTRGPVLSLLLAFTLAGSGAQAETVPAKGAVDSRIRVAAYDAAEVYKLKGFVGYQIDLEFEPGETFVGLGAGDLEGLSFVGQENHLFLKPKASKVATNLTVLTSRRHYQFDYTALPQRPSEEDVVYALRFTYAPPAARSAAETAARKLDSQLDGASSRRPRNIDYWYCGQSALRPSAVSDDGVHTRLTFAANADLPAIFVRNEDDSESLLNFSMDAGDVVIHRIAQRFILRRGKLTGCVVNRGYTGGGERLESGTVAPDVERRVQRGKP